MKSNVHSLIPTVRRRKGKEEGKGKDKEKGKEEGKGKGGSNVRPVDVGGEEKMTKRDEDLDEKKDNHGETKERDKVKDFL